MSGSLRVVQLNLGSLFESSWEARRHEVVAWLRQLRPDIVCFQEVWQDATNENTAGWIAVQIPDLANWAFGGSPIPHARWSGRSLLFGCAVLSRWPIDALVQHRLPTATDNPAAPTFSREFIHAQTAGLDIFVCHLSAAPTDGLDRQAQVQAIDTIVNTTRGKLDAMPSEHGALRDAMPAILCGDFNAEPESDEIRFMTSLTALGGRMTFWQDAWRVAGDGPGYTQDWRTNDLSDGLNLHRKRIDYIFVGDPFVRRGKAGRITSVGVVFDQPLTGVLASDHFGLVADIVWPDRPNDPARVDR